jgi:hypothetical protein
MVINVQFLQRHLMSVFLWAFLKIFICLNKANITRERKSPRGHALLYRSPKYVINNHRTVQNTAACIITRTPRNCHTTPVLKELHWLPVHIRVEYKLLTHVFKPFHGQAPTYIRNMLDIYIPSRQLRSQNDCLALVVPRNRTATCDGSPLTLECPT